MLEIVLTPKRLGPPKFGPLGVSLFSLMVNPRLLLTLPRHSRLYRALHPKLQATDCLIIFRQYLVQYYFAALDVKPFLLSDIAQALPVLTDMHVPTHCVADASFRPVVPKLFRTVTPIKVAIMSYYPQ